MTDLTAEAVLPPLYARLPRRIQALSLDVAIVFGALIVLIVLASYLPDAAARWVLRLSMLGVIVYEPLLTAYAGGTLGHRALNLRVQDARTGGRLTLPRALLRWTVKSVLGWLSFLSMSFTRRHQAIHDLLSQGVVCVRDPSRADAVHYVEERPEADPPHASGRASVGLRAAVALGYLLVIYEIGGVVLRTGMTPDCRVAGVCSSGDDAVAVGVLGGWLALAIVIVGLAWRGKLPGARHGPVAADPAVEPAE